jgi:CheY-like chemotaxis protein
MKTILVVDDEFDLASTVRAILEGEGYRVETCSNGREALERLRGGPRPDLVLTDVMMPLVSGFEVLQSMRQTPGLEAVPVAVMSSVAPGVRREDYGWQAFLRKPFRLEALMKTVRQLIGAPSEPVGGQGA